MRENLRKTTVRMFGAELEIVPKVARWKGCLELLAPFSRAIKIRSRISSRVGDVSQIPAVKGLSDIRRFKSERD